MSTGKTTDGDRHSCCGSSVLKKKKVRVLFVVSGGYRKIYGGRGNRGARTLLLPSLGSYVFIG